MFFVVVRQPRFVVGGWFLLLHIVVCHLFCLMIVVVYLIVGVMRCLFVVGWRFFVDCRCSLFVVCCCLMICVVRYSFFLVGCLVFARCCVCVLLCDVVCRCVCCWLFVVCC